MMQRTFVQHSPPGWQGWTRKRALEECPRRSSALKSRDCLRRTVSSVLGCNTLIAPSAFARAHRNWGTLERWDSRMTDSPPASSTVYSLLTLTPPEQRQVCLACRGLAAGEVWFAITRRSTLDPQVRTLLTTRGVPVAAKGSWRNGKVRATKTAESWTLWASSVVVTDPQRLAELKLRLSNLRLTADGVDPSDSSGRESSYRLAYQYLGALVATDCSLKDDGRMGAACVSMGDRIPARSVAVFGSASSTRSDLTAIALALEGSPPGEDFTILTDSLVAMTTLFSLRRADFPLSLYRNACPPCRQLLTNVVSLLTSDMPPAWSLDSLR
jgi:hypothetical protein